MMRLLVALVSLLFLAIAPALAATSYQVNNGASLAITEFSVCKLVTNNHASGLAIFVPTATSGEWSAFYGNVPAGVTAVACDTTPNAFSFTDRTNVALNTLTTSNSVTITGINVPTSVSVSGQGSPQISINGGAWGTSGTIANGQSLQVRLTSANAGSTMYSATVTVGTGTDQWDVTTAAGCGGVQVGGYCWYAGANGANCMTTCSTHGGYHTATLDYAGSNGTDAQCIGVLDALGLGSGGLAGGFFASGLGCVYSGTSRHRVGAPLTTEAAAASGHQRACACNN